MRPDRRHCRLTTLSPRPSALLELLEERRLFATFDVTSNLDLPTPGTLRFAITMADTLPGADTITFHLPTGITTIQPLTDLPAITGPTTLDATTQPGYSGTPLVYLDGSAALQLSGIGLDVTGGNSTLRGLAISGFNTEGVHLGGTGSSHVESSYIGTDPTGSPDTPPAAQNFNGIVINSANNVITSNVISNNFRDGIHINAGGNNTQITANRIGTDATGTAAFPNSGSGISVTTASGTLIGGTTPAQRNLISANGGDGVLIDATGSGNVISGNYIGTDITGAAPLGNQGDGIRVTAPAPGTSTNLLIGGTVAGTRNIISSNFGDGIGIIDAAGVRVFNNYIGTDLTGTSTDFDQLGNFGNGVFLSGAAANTQIGGPSAAHRNLISDNSGDGIRSTATGSGNTIQGNYIGTNATADAAIGNFGNGVSILGTGVLIGGATSAAGNIISSNFGFGLLLTSGSSVQFNLIGTAADATSPLGNLDDNIDITGSDNQIGSATAGNTIAFSGQNGVTVEPSPSNLRNSIRGNDIFSNTGLGIDLGNDGVTLNDPEDPDVGPNNFQNFPDLSSVSLSGSTATVTGNLNSTPLTTFTLDFFASQIWDDTHYGEGQQYLGSLTVTTDATGNAPFTTTLPNVRSGYNYFASTATDPTGNTSEFDYDPPANQPAKKSHISLARTSPSSTLLASDTPNSDTIDPDILGTTDSTVF